jgi:hypothetical protein
MTGPVQGFAQFPKNGAGFDVNVYKAVDDNGKSEFLTKFRELNQAWEREERYLAVTLNYDDLIERTLEKPKMLGDTKLNHEEVGQWAVFQFGRLFANYLSSYRMYLDHAEARLKRDFGHDSDAVKSFKGKCAQLYDSHFVYRFFYKIRNYMLHHGNPVNHARQEDKLVLRKPQSSGLVFGIDGRKLVDLVEWPKAMRDDIKVFEWPLILNDALPQHMNLLKEVHVNVVRNYSDRDRGAIDYFIEILRMAPAKDLDVSFFEAENIGPKMTFHTMCVPQTKIAFIKTVHDLTSH